MTNDPYPTTFSTQGGTIELEILRDALASYAERMEHELSTWAPLYRGMALGMRTRAIEALDNTTREQDEKSAGRS